MDVERFERAMTLRNSGRVEESLQELKELVRAAIDPEEKAALVLNESRCLETLGRFREARQRSDDARRISKAAAIQSRADFGEANLDWLEGKRDEALGKLTELLKTYAQLLSTPEHHDLYEETQFRRGVLLTELGRYGEGRPVLEECLSFDLEPSDKGDVLYNLGFCYMKTGDPDRAKEKFLETLEHGAQDVYLVRAHYRLGVIYSREGAHAKALHEFETCLPRSEEAQIPKQDVYAWLATTARSLGRTGDADYYEKLARPI
jgi:tetratricopeptide (TPR) repeat protein